MFAKQTAGSWCFASLVQEGCGVSQAWGVSEGAFVVAAKSPLEKQTSSPSSLLCPFRSALAR